MTVSIVLPHRQHCYVPAAHKSASTLTAFLS